MKAIRNCRQPAGAAVEPLGELSEKTKALLLLAVSLVLIGLVGWASALVLQASTLSDGQFRVVGRSTLVVAIAGVLAGAWGFRFWRRDGLAYRTSALKLNWFHAVMSQTNRLILRRPNPRELFEGVCEVCVEAGHMELVIIDLSDIGEVHRAVADASAERFATLLAPQRWDAARLQTLLTMLTLRAGRPIVIDDAATDARLGEANAWSDATGLCSLAAIPLARGGAQIGVLLLHAKAKAFFDGNLKPLLSELGADLSFALDNADREQERHEASMADRARTKAEDANRAKTEFLAQMSHELRTPLNAILGFAQLLATDRAQALSPGQAERVRLITHAGWHLLGLVNDVMDMARIESGRFEVVNACCDISSTLDEAVALMQPLARTHRIDLAERTAPRSGIGAVVDPRRLHQVLLNLLSNACKYNRPGGHVRIDVTRAGTDVLIDVVDGGVGMTAEQLSHLFEPFDRLGHEGHAIDGSGIGLALTRQLVEMMNGRLEIESSPVSGTRARVALTACAIPLRTMTSQAPIPRIAMEPQSSAIVLYIEDDPINQIIVEQMLLPFEGVYLLKADNATDGIALAQQRKPNLVLLDMHLPDMTGFEVLAALRADPRTEALRVVALSADAIPADIEMAMELGALDYWTKPLNLQDFLTEMAALLQVRVTADDARTGGAAP